MWRLSVCSDRERYGMTEDYRGITFGGRTFDGWTSSSGHGFVPRLYSTIQIDGVDTGSENCDRGTD